MQSYASGQVGATTPVLPCLRALTLRVMDVIRGFGVIFESEDEGRELLFPLPRNLPSKFFHCCVDSRQVLGERGRVRGPNCEKVQLQDLRAGLVCYANSPPWLCP